MANLNKLWKTTGTLMEVATVVFNPAATQGYDYVVPTAWGVQPGDLLLVDTPKGITERVFVLETKPMSELDLDGKIQYKNALFHAPKHKLEAIRKDAQLLAKQLDQADSVVQSSINKARL